MDTQGLPHAMHITAADVTDRAGALEMIDANRAGLARAWNVLADGGYSGEPFRAAVKELIVANVEIAKRNELHKFVVMPKRWVVERSFSWLEKCHRLWKNCEKLATSALAMMQMAFIRLLLKRL